MTVAKRLTAKQEKFAAEYLKDRNTGEAAKRAGYSPHAAASIGRTLLRNPAIRSIVDKQTEALRTESRADAAFVVRELMKVAEQDDVAQSTKVRALELLAKINGMLEDRISLKTDGLSGEQRAERVAILLERVASRRE